MRLDYQIKKNHPKYFVIVTKAYNLKHLRNAVSEREKITFHSDAIMILNTSF